MCSYNRRYAEVCGSEPQAGGGCESVQLCSRDTGSARAAGRTDQHAARRQPPGGSDPVQTGPEEELGQRAAPGPAGTDAHTLEGREIGPSVLALLETAAARAAHEEEHTTRAAAGYHTTHTQHTHTKHTSGGRETHRSLFYECLIDNTSIRALARFISIANHFKAALQRKRNRCHIGFSVQIMYYICTIMVFSHI